MCTLINEVGYRNHRQWNRGKKGVQRTWKVLRKRV